MLLLSSEGATCPVGMCLPELIPHLTLLPVGCGSGQRGWSGHQESLPQGRACSAVPLPCRRPPPPPPAAAPCPSPRLSTFHAPPMSRLLQDKKGRLYIVTALTDTKVDLKGAPGAAAEPGPPAASQRRPHARPRLPRRTCLQQRTLFNLIAKLCPYHMPACLPARPPACLPVRLPTAACSAVGAAGHRQGRHPPGARRAHHLGAAGAPGQRHPPGCVPGVGGGRGAAAGPAAAGAAAHLCAPTGQSGHHGAVS